MRRRSLARPTVSRCPTPGLINSPGCTLCRGPPHPGSWVTPLMTFQGGPGGNHLLEVGGSVSVPCQLHPGLYEASSTRNPPEPFSVQCGLADGIFFFFSFACVRFHSENISAPQTSSLVTGTAGVSPGRG